MINKKTLLIIILAITFFAMKIKDLSPKFKIPSSERELTLKVGQVPMGSQQGGLNLFSNKFRRGAGDAVFGSDERGIWLGGAEFPDAPFQVSMEGEMVAKSATFKDEDNLTIIDAKGLVSTSSFVSDSVVKQVTTRTTNSVNFVDVPNTSITFNLARIAKVLFLLQGDFSNYAGDGGIASQYVALDIDGVLYPDSLNGFGNTHFWADVSGNDVTVVTSTWHGHYLATLGEGEHTAKMKFCKQGVATVDARVINTQLTYIVLGK